MPDHDIPGFRRALSLLSPRQRIALELRCDGLAAVAMGPRMGTSAIAAARLITVAIEKLREAPDLADASERAVIGAICYRLGYEQALADIEATMARKRAAA